MYLLGQGFENNGNDAGVAVAQKTATRFVVALGNGKGKTLY